MSLVIIKFKQINPVVLASTLLVSTILFNSVPAYADVTYGPVKANDTLSKIVNRFYVGTNRSSIRLMKNIVSKNPHAFVRGNMNLLKRDALLTLPSNDWLVNEPRFVSPSNSSSLLKQANASGFKNQEGQQLPSRTFQQMQDRMVFLEAERVSLIAQVEALKRETVNLETKVKQLELDSDRSDEQLRVLDKEIIRLTKLLGKGTGAATGEVSLSQLTQLQAQLRSAQQETERLRNELLDTQTELSNNSFLKAEADKTIAQLSQENQQLQLLLQEAQPGVHYFGESSKADQLSLFGGKFNIPIWGLIMGGALLSLIVISLLATRRKQDEVMSDEFMAPGSSSSDINTYDSLLETPSDSESRGFAQTAHEPEENVFKMFDEGTLEMDLKLDMAEAYLQVSDFDSAKLVLQEVLEGGSDLQQRKASRLMRQAA